MGQTLSGRHARRAAHLPPYSGPYLTGLSAAAGPPLPRHPSARDPSASSSLPNNPEQPPNFCTPKTMARVFRRIRGHAPDPCGQTLIKSPAAGETWAGCRRQPHLCRLRTAARAAHLLQQHDRLHKSDHADCAGEPAHSRASAPSPRPPQEGEPAAGPRRQRRRGRPRRAAPAPPARRSAGACRRRRRGGPRRRARARVGLWAGRGRRGPARAARVTTGARCRCRPHSLLRLWCGGRACSDASRGSAVLRRCGERARRASAAPSDTAGSVHRNAAHHTSIAHTAEALSPSLG